MVSLTQQFFTQLVQQQVLGNAFDNILCASTPIDPILFLALLQEHRLTLFGLHALKNYHPDQQKLLEALTLSAMQQLRWQLVLGHALLGLTKLMQSNDILYVILKGAPLNQQLYGDKILRSSGDIDMLINVVDLQRTHRLLIQAGYELDTTLSKTSPEDLVVFPNVLKIMKDVSYRHRQHKTLLELHWNISQMADCNLGVITEQMRTTVTMRDKIVHVLTPEYNFIYLCFHASKHQWERWQWLVDIAIFYQKIPLDWSQIIHIAQKHYCLRPLLEAKQLLLEYFLIDLPYIPYTQQDKRAIHKRLGSTYKLWLSKNVLPIKRRHPYYEVFYQLFLLPHYRQKIVFLWNIFWQGERALLQRVAGHNRVKILIMGVFHKCTRMFARQ